LNPLLLRAEAKLQVAAAKLGIPPWTLDSKIKQPGIKKDNFKTVA
jgi:hypothetical protein